MKTIGRALALCAMLCLLLAFPPTARADAGGTAYLDERGDSQTAQAIPLTSGAARDENGAVRLGAGWYAVAGDVEFNNANGTALAIDGDVNLILCDGASLTLTASSFRGPGGHGYGVDCNGHAFSLYAQSAGGDMGRLRVEVSDGSSGSNNAEGVYLNGGGSRFSLYGGAVDIRAAQDGVYGAGDFRMNGGRLAVEAKNNGVRADKGVEITGGELRIAAQTGVWTVNGRLHIGGGTVVIADASRGLDACSGGVLIDGGTVDISAMNEGIRTSDSAGGGVGGEIGVIGGDVRIRTRQADGIHAMDGGSVVIAGGSVRVSVEPGYHCVSAGSGGSVTVADGVTDLLTDKSGAAVDCDAVELFLCPTEQADVLGWGTGDGSPDAPYVISSTMGLDLLAVRVNGGDDQSGKTFRLGGDIVYGASCAWDDPTGFENNFTPIGTKNRPFLGTFDGCGYADAERKTAGYRICGLRVYRLDEPDTPLGLFGFVGRGGVVQNVFLEDARVTSALDGHGRDKTFLLGGVAGHNEGTVRDCFVSRTAVSGMPYTDGSTVTGSTCAGAVVGQNTGTVRGNYYERCLVVWTAEQAAGEDAPLKRGVGVGNQAEDMAYAYAAQGLAFADADRLSLSGFVFNDGDVYWYAAEQYYGVRAAEHYRLAACACDGLTVTKREDMPDTFLILVDVLDGLAAVDTTVELVPSLTGGAVTAPPRSALILALYDADGRLTGARFRAVPEECRDTPLSDFGLSLPESGAYKLMLLDGRTFLPLCLVFDGAADEET